MSRSVFRNLPVLLLAPVIALLSMSAFAVDQVAEVRTLLEQSFKAMQAAGSFRATSEADQAGKSVKVVNEMVWPDRFHITSGAQEFIFVPGGTWMKQGKSWNRLPVDMSQMAQSLSPDAMRQSLANLTNARVLGEEKLDGHDAIVIEYDTSATVMGIATRSHVKAWIDAKSKLPLKQEVSGTAMGRKSDSVTTYEFVPGLRIEAPN